MNKRNFAYLLLSCLLFIQCTKSEDSLKVGTEELNLVLDCTENSAPCELVPTINEFGFEVTSKLHEAAPSANLFISPMSISTAISMVTNGADGTTKEAILETLNLEDWQLEQINQAYLVLLSQLPELDEEVKLQIANSIWYRESFSVLPAFLDVNSEYYNSEIKEADFSLDETVDEINSWVEDKTEGLIDKILDEIPENAVMYLINAIYFKGSWTNAFNPEYTYDGTFFTETGQESVPFMNLGKKELAYFENETFQAVNLPYGDSLFAMSIFLPIGKNTVEDVLSSMTVENWDLWNEQYKTTEVEFTMPKFEMAYEKELKDILSDMGMGIAFSDAADLSNINDEVALKISKVKHKSFITVDEEGTEAAAVTIIGIEVTSLPIHPVMKVNKPFVFVIRDHTSNSVLFIGKMMTPNE